MPGSAVKNVEDIYALSSLQQRMLVRALAAPHQGALVEQLTCTLQGDLDAAALRRAWQTVVARHPALRTALVWEGLKKPLQIVRRQVTVPWHEEDLGALPPKQRQRQCQAILAAQRE
ncbi:MAG TPA: non-ribosomal peptide synthetase, partial [Planctomycetaceae bacterium]|nr:non-ribosomal peptide synthetase [Planctomycetaceae bacterium]